MIDHSGREGQRAQLHVEIPVAMAKPNIGRQWSAASGRATKPVYVIRGVNCQAIVVPSAIAQIRGLWKEVVRLQTVGRQQLAWLEVLNRKAS